MPFLADKMKKLTSILTLFVFIVVPVFATTIHIPGDYSTIQAGIDAASDGDTVLVSAERMAKDFEKLYLSIYNQNS